MCLAFPACMCISSRCFIKIKETWQFLSFFPPFVFPVMPFTFPVAEKQELKYMHYEIILPENSMGNLSNPSQVITREKK